MGSGILLKCPFPKMWDVLGALLSSTYTVEWFWQSSELNQTSETTEEKGGWLGGQMLSLPLTFAVSLRNDMELGLCSFL